MPIVPLTSLWLPILLSAVFVFVASSVIHMASGLHKHDHVKLPQEDAVLEALRKAGVQPGSYRFPYAESMKECGTPEMLAKWQRGPVGMATILPNGSMAIGKSLAQWFVYSLVISLFAAYVGNMCLPAGTDYMRVFRVTGTVAVLGYALSNVTNSIWKGESWGTTAKFVFDGTIYGLLTAGTFGWLWPSA